MKKHIYTVTIMAVLAGICHSGCTSAAEEPDTTTIMQPTKFDGAQGDCTNGGVKIEVLVNGTVDETQTQYICNDTQGETGETGQSGSSSTIQTTKFDGVQGDCTNGGVKIELLVNGVVDGTQTQYICNGTQGQDGQSGTSTSIKTTKFDGAQGDCTNGGVKIEVLVNGVVDSTQTQYICNSAASVTCGNGVLEAGEACDGGFIAEGVAPSCPSGQEAADTLVCVTDGCTFDLTASCVPEEVCGDNKVGANEICDIVDGNTVINTILAEDVPNGLCSEYDSKYISGSLVCNATCDDFDVTQCVESPAEVYVVGDIITFGHYEQDNDTTNGKEPIEWRVLDVNAEGQLLVISDKVLEKKKYNETNIDITWEKSTIRSWLNGYAASYNANETSYTSNNFIDAAFTAEEQAKIVASNVPAHKNPIYSTSPGNATTDKIFLLSIVEAKQYFANDTARLADATRYAVKQGLSVRGTDTVSTSDGTHSSDGTCVNVHCYAYWWLRSPGSHSAFAARVDDSGAVDTFGSYVNRDLYGVRPALWLDY